MAFFKRNQQAEGSAAAAKKRFFRKNPNKIKESKFDLAVNIINITLLVLFVIVVIFPLLSFFSLAFSNSALNGQVVIIPRGFTLYAFKYVMTGTEGALFWRSVLNSVIVTATITVVSNLVEALAAFPLSKRDCPFKGGIMMYFVITMLFSAGLAPIYLLMHMFGLTDSIWAVILVSISNVSNLLYFKVFFEGLPVDIEEAATLDGATNLQMFFRIVLPMSLPVVGSCCFFVIVGTWNSYGGTMMFIGSSVTDQHTLAYYIYLMVDRLSSEKNDPQMVASLRNIEAAAMFLSMIPILCMYPYVIRYIKSGIMVGSVKG